MILEETSMLGHKIVQLTLDFASSGNILRIGALYSGGVEMPKLLLRAALFAAFSQNCPIW